MAILAEMEQARAERERRETAFRKYAIEKYGGNLGTAFYDYLHRGPRTERTGEEQEKKEIAFAKAITDKFNSQDPTEKSLGVAAVLESTRLLIAPVARRAMDNYSRTMPVGLKQ